MQMNSEQQEMLQDDGTEMQARQRALDAAISQVDEEIAAVETGTHPELLRSCRKLQQAREKREKAAQQTYEAELLTLERLHELEMVSNSTVFFIASRLTVRMCHRRKPRRNSSSEASRWLEKRFWTK